MHKGRSLASGRLVAMASAVAVFAGGCTVVLSEHAPPRIILTPRPIRTLVIVPAVTGRQFEMAEAALVGGQLEVGEVNWQRSSLPVGSVISQNPRAGSVARSGTKVKLTLAISVAQARVPSVVGKSLVVARIKLRLAGLQPGNVSYQSVVGVTSPRVGSQSHAAGSRVPLGTSVDLVVNNPTSKISVPSVLGKNYFDALRSLHGAGLRVTGRSSRQHPTIKKGYVVSQNPFGGSLVDPRSGVTVVLSSGIGTVAVPYVTGKTPASAIGALVRAGLRPTIEYKAMAGVPGRVASQTPSSGSRADRGTIVKLVVRKAMPAHLRVTVPNVKGKLPGEARTILTTAGLSVGAISQGPGRPGRVVSQSRASGTRVARGTSVALVIGKLVTPSRVRVSVPNVVGIDEAAAGAALRRVGLAVGTVSRIAGLRPGKVLKQSPTAGMRVARGAKINLTVATRRSIVVRVSVPNVVGMQEAAANSALRRVGLQVGTVTKVRGAKEGSVVTQSPSAASRVPRGSKVNLTVSTRRVTTVRVTVPRVVGLQEAAASTAIRRVGLVVGTVTKVAGAAQGKILKQSPPGGSRVARGTRIALTVSVKSASAWGRPPTSTKPQVTVPNFVGMTLGQVRVELKKSGFELGTISRKRIPGAKRGRIAQQKPAAGTKADKGSKVNLVFAK